MLALMNASRLQQGLVPLALDVRASDAARRHSATEAEHRYVYHDGGTGQLRRGTRPRVEAGGTARTPERWSGGVDVLHHEFMLSRGAITTDENHGSQLPSRRRRCGPGPRRGLRHRGVLP